MDKWQYRTVVGHNAGSNGTPEGLRKLEHDLVLASWLGRLGSFRYHWWCHRLDEAQAYPIGIAALAALTPFMPSEPTPELVVKADLAIEAAAEAHVGALQALLVNWLTRLQRQSTIDVASYEGDDFKLTVRIKKRKK